MFVKPVISIENACEALFSTDESLSQELMFLLDESENIFIQKHVFRRKGNIFYGSRLSEDLPSI